MGRGLLSIVMGGVMVVGGLSGNLVMRGTNSGGALAIAGFVVVGIGIFRIVQSNNQNGGGGGSPPPPSNPPGA